MTASKEFILKRGRIVNYNYLKLKRKNLVLFLYERFEIPQDGTNTMARTIRADKPQDMGLLRMPAGYKTGETERDIYFRALVDLGTGGVAGIEAAQARHVRSDGAPGRFPGWHGRMVHAQAATLSAWGREVREPAAYLVRAQLDVRVDAVAERLHVAPEKIILMFAVTQLLAQPTSALETLIAGKRSGARILLDHIDLVDPPARFIEMLPADILRVAPGRMPWHWEEDRRAATMQSLLAFAGNLLMDVAVEGVDSDGQCRAFKRLGVRYAQGGWRRDHSGLVPDPARL
jgi:predicted signal transduction protein with EAL and GGDEF domain